MLLIALVAALGLAPGSAAARPVAVAASCHAGASLSETYPHVAADPGRWVCQNDEADLQSETTFIRFDLKPDAAAAPPRSFVTHYGRFERITLSVLDANGSLRSLDYPIDSFHRINAGPFISAKLPAIGPDSIAVVARIERPWIDYTINDARLDDEPLGSGWPIGRLAVLAVLCGILLVPLLLDTAFYWAMPQRYVLWHLIMVAATILQLAVLSGLLGLVAEVPLSIEVMISDFSFAVLCAGALNFSRTFVEPGMLPKGLDRAMALQAPLGVVLVAAITLALPGLRPWGVLLIHLALLPSVLLLLASLVIARLNGSRAVLFQIVGMTPVLLIAAGRIASFAFAAKPDEMPVAFHAALAFEALVTAIAIISRFAAMRRERDLAHSRVEELKGVAGRDPLTGLSNRRSLEIEFGGWYGEGFSTMAVIDLDHFKSVNDSKGHAVGDAVLRAVALALAPDADTKVVRVGGEEFLLLLRGADAFERAERRRQAIPTRVASEVAGLDQLVTASMGIVHHGLGGSRPPSFLDCYRHCDRLLYEAKHSGRNRTAHERVVGFSDPPKRNMRSFG